MKKLTLTTMVLGVLSIATNAQNVVINGDFSAGSTGFTTEYTQSCSGSNSLFNESTYCVLADPSSSHPLFTACPDHTSGGGNMMVVNGATSNSGVTGLPKIVWSQTVPVTPGTSYNFAFYAISVYSSNPAQLRFRITGFTGVTQGSTFTSGLNTLNSTTCDYSQPCFGWNSGTSTSAVISIIDENQNATGNDFALDDIRFYPLLPAQTACSISSLPVTWRYVTAKLANGSSALINWGTTDERNVLRYEVEKSTNGKDFTRIGSVNRSNENLADKNYVFTDNSFTGPVAYYRILQRDIDGTTDFSATATVRSAVHATTNTLSVFPNPAGSEMSYQVNSVAGGSYSLALVNITGQAIWNETITAEGTAYKGSIPRGAIPAGIYLLKIQNAATHESAMQKVVFE